MFVLYPHKINAFAPICKGYVKESANAASVVSFYFRLSRSTQIFLGACATLLMGMTAVPNWHLVHASPEVAPEF